MSWGYWNDSRCMFCSVLHADIAITERLSVGGAVAGEVRTVSRRHLSQISCSQFGQHLSPIEKSVLHSWQAPLSIGGTVGSTNTIFCRLGLSPVLFTGYRTHSVHLPRSCEHFVHILSRPNVVWHEWQVYRTLIRAFFSTLSTPGFSDRCQSVIFRGIPYFS